MPPSVVPARSRWSLTGVCSIKFAKMTEPKRNRTPYIYVREHESRCAGLKGFYRIVGICHGDDVVSLVLQRFVMSKLSQGSSSTIRMA